jgi:uncharacterized protein (TIGR03435 family)
MRCRWTFEHATMQMLAGALSTILGSPVVDASALTKEYDFSLIFLTAGTSLQTGPGLGKGTWAGIGAGPADPALIEATPDIFGAVQLLGLKLERDKASKNTIVIDHIERIPTGNYCRPRLGAGYELYGSPPARSFGYGRKFAIECGMH